MSFSFKFCFFLKKTGASDWEDSCFTMMSFMASPCSYLLASCDDKYRNNGNGSTLQLAMSRTANSSIQDAIFYTTTLKYKHL